MADNITIQAKESPRFEGKTIKWYAGNTFPYTLTIKLVDGESGEPLEILPEHTIVARWYSGKKSNLVKEFTYSNLSSYELNGEKFTDVTMDFDEETTALFDVGTYNYCVTYYGEQTTTIAANMGAEVEKCH